MKIQPLVVILLHHVFAGFAFLTCIGIGKCTWFGALLLWTEATNPVNNFYWTLEKAGYAKKPIYHFVGRVFFVSWVIFRMSIFPFLFYKTYAVWDEIDTLEFPFFMRFNLLLNSAFLFAMNYTHFFQTIRHLWNAPKPRA
jgi:hypothetical protein